MHHTVAMPELGRADLAGLNLNDERRFRGQLVVRLANEQLSAICGKGHMLNVSFDTNWRKRRRRGGVFENMECLSRAHCESFRSRVKSHEWIGRYGVRQGPLGA